MHFGYRSSAKIQIIPDFYTLDIVLIKQYEEICGNIFFLFWDGWSKLLLMHVSLQKLTLTLFFEGDLLW